MDCVEVYHFRFIKPSSLDKKKLNVIRQELGKVGLNFERVSSLDGIDSDVFVITNALSERDALEHQVQRVVVRTCGLPGIEYRVQYLGVVQYFLDIRSVLAYPGKR